MEETRMRELIREIIEMPYPRGKYKDKVDAELPQVFINYCLVRYRTLTNTEPYKKHWKGDDSIESRRKIFNEILLENDYNMPQFMSLTVCNKFIEEQINIKSEEYEQAVIDCIKSIPDIFELILNRNIDDVKSYVDSI